MLEKLFEIDLNALSNDALKWGSEYLADPNTLYQGVVIMLSFSFGFLLYHVIRPKVKKAIDTSDLPGRAKRIANNIRKLLYPLVTLVTLFVGTQIAGSEAVGLDITILDGIMKVLLAWIIIRILAQFIDNNAVRNVFALSIWIVVALSIFGVLDQTMTTLDDFGFTIGSFRLSALAVIKSAFYLFALIYFATFVSSFAERRVLKSSGLTRSSQVLIAKIIRVILIVIAILIGVTSSGIDLSLFAVFGGAIGLGIGFGLQQGISNLFSGMLLLVDRSIKPGDVIELENGTFGWVNNMAARYTEIVTRDNKSFLIPNEEFITQRVVNWSHGNEYIRINVDFGVHYDSDMHKVIEIAKEAATKPERVVTYRTPVCWITEFGDSSVNFTLRFWIKDAQNGLTNVRGEVLLALWDAFKEHDISIPYPHREVYVHEAPKKAPAKKKPATKAKAKPKEDAKDKKAS